MNKLEKAVFLDCKQLIQKFVRHDNPKFEVFCQEWKRMHIMYIFLILNNDQETTEIVSMFSRAIKILLLNGQTYLERIGALYTFYALFFKQQDKTPCRLKVTDTDWKDIKEFIEIIRNHEDTEEAIYIFWLLVSSNAFRFVVDERDYGLEAEENYKAEQGETEDNNIKVTEVDDVRGDTGWVTAFQILGTRYNEVQKLQEGNQSENSLNVAEFLNELRTHFDFLMEDLDNSDEEYSDENSDENEFLEELKKKKDNIGNRRMDLKKRSYLFQAIGAVEEINKNTDDLKEPNGKRTTKANLKKKSYQVSSDNEACGSTETNSFVRGPQRGAEVFEDVLPDEILKEIDESI